MGFINEKLPPSQLEKDISLRCQEIESVLQKTNARIVELQKLKLHGRVKIVHTKKQYSCIYYEKSGQKKGKFVRKADLNTAKLVSEYNYLKKLRKALTLQLRSLKRTHNVLKRVKLPMLSMGHSLFTEPVTYKDSVYAELWQNKKVAGPIRDTEYITRKGEKVCSKSELLIANALQEHGIPYHYERPLKLQGGTIHPDFTCLNKRTHQEFYWEHLGMMDTPSYAANAVLRMKKYRQHDYIIGKKLLTTWETKDEHLGSADINAVINSFLI